MKLTDISTVRSIMAAHGTDFKKKFGQNFLINEGIPRRIAEECGAEPEDAILEIGPGIGTLTRELAARYRKVVAVEIDPALIPILSETLSDFENVTVIHADILKLDLSALFREYFAGQRVTVCANLPYYITTPILMHLLESHAPVDHITVMVQKEVASRLAAAPGTPEYGAITASVRYYASIRRLFTVSAGSFMPAPKVDSAVVRLSLYKEKPHTPADEGLMFRVLRAVFSMRRKTLLNTLGSEFSEIGKEDLRRLLTEAGYAPDIRGEVLDVPDFCGIADKILQFTHIL